MTAMMQRSGPSPDDDVGFDPFVVQGFYSEDLLGLIRMQIANLKAEKGPEDHEIFHRREYHDHPLFQALHGLMVPRIEKWLARAVKPSYAFTSLYFPGRGKCPKHFDRPQCRYTVDVCIDQKRPWEFRAKDRDGTLRAYALNAGDAIIMSGTHHEHERPTTLPADNFCDMAFFHFVDPNFEGPLK